MAGQIGDLFVTNAIRVVSEKRARRGEIFTSLVEAINAKALFPSQGKIGAGFVLALRLAVVMCKHLHHLGQAIATTALDFVRNFQVQRTARLAEQALIERIPY